MFTVAECAWQQHDHGLVLLAAGLWVLGSVAFFLSLKRSRECGTKRRRQWSAVGAITGGVGVWATHFIAMLAYHGVMPIAFGVPLTMLSVIVAVAAFGAALAVLTPAFTVRRCLLAGVLATAGVGAMHFVGMAAIIAPARLRYDPIPILYGVAEAALLFSAAFLAFARLKGASQILVAAVPAIIAVCILHFAGMAATTLVPDPAYPAPSGGFDRTWLIAVIALASTALLFVTGIAVVIDRYLTDLRGLADATLEGLAIVQDDHIVELNHRFAEMLETDMAALTGTSPDRWLIAAETQPVAAPRVDPIEARLARFDLPDRVLEIAAHAIEYRGRDCTVLAVRDLTDKKAAQRRIEHMARHDTLTNLPNRLLLDERITHALTRAERERQSLALLAIDLDRFKAVNDLFGHAAGDSILCRVAEILENAIRGSDTVARIGGDEFMVLQVGASQPEGARSLVDRIMADFALEMDTARDPMAVRCSIGVAIYPDDGTDAAKLRHGADIALYRAKAAGRGTTCFFDQEMDAEVQERRALEHDLRHAVLRGQIHTVYQPLVVMADGSVSGYEALLRWDHPERGAIPPDIFIPIAEDSGSIVQLGEWVLRDACRVAAGWADHISLAVNVSAVQFQVPNLAETIATILREEGFAPERLELEITESALMKDRVTALATLRRIKALGIRVVMDDFGTGYSSLSNLQSFPFDKIKIDRSFIASMEDDAAARSIIRAIVGIGKSLELPVVAEGVETEAQHRMVVEAGCPHAQGYLFGYPQSASLNNVEVRWSAVTAR
jgi:diguanylate cyclase (GGDEF)-like protein